LRQRILILLGIAVAVLGLYTFAFRSRGELANAGTAAVEVADAKPGKTVRPAKTDKAPSPATADTTTALTPKVLPPETWGADPFVRDWVMVNELANIRLKAITLGGDSPYALINDQILQEDDEISGKRITKIESDRVTLEQGGRTFTLLLGE